jgi:hypothetical protein
LITSSPVNHGSQTTSTDFRNKIGHEQTSRQSSAKTRQGRAAEGLVLSSKRSNCLAFTAGVAWTMKREEV